MNAYSSATLQSPFDAFLEDIADLGVHPGPHDGGGCEYALIAARSNQRWWLTPVNCGGECARAGLEMFQPVTWAARVARLGMRLCARYTPASLPGGRLHLAGAPDFLRIFAQPGLCCAYFTGTAGPHRKTTAQVMTGSGEIIGYAKVSRNPAVKRYLENEAHVLSELARLGLGSVDVPRLLERREGGNGDDIAWLVTDSLRAPGHAVALRLGPAHHAFLAELAGKTAKPGDGVATLTVLSRAAEMLRPKLENEWIARIAAGISRLAEKADALPVAMAHGDFTPWNSFLVRGRLYVFDWEYAHPAYPLGYDEIHFTLSANPTEMAATLLQSLETALAARWYDGDHARATQALLFSLLLHASFYLGRAVAAGGDARDWEEAPRRAAMIDALLARAGE